jgi:Xaa-Pro aminopeptidase
MELAIESYLYVRSAVGVPEKFHNISIRIGDGAMVNDRGCELISRGSASGVGVIERLMKP